MTAAPPLDDYRTALVTSTLTYARRVAGSVIAPECHGDQRADLVADGVLGLVQAARAYRRPVGRPGDPAADARFRAYAAQRVRGAVLDSLRAKDPLSRSQRRALRRSAADARADQRPAVPFSIVPNVENLARTPQVAPRSHGLSPAVVAALRALPALDRAVLVATSANGRTLRDVAEEVGLSESGVCRIRQRALAAVRRSLGEEVSAA